MQEESESEPFEKIVSALDYPVFVVTTTSGDGPSGCLVGFASQTSIHPPRFLVGLSRRNRTYRVAQGATHLAVHLLGREAADLAALFGGQTGDRVNKFDQCEWHEGPAGMPILDGAAAWFVGEIRDRFDLGDHVGHLLQPTAGTAPDGLQNWLSFADVRDLEPGHDA
ncbi:flavin reductase family protein [Mycolicibacterium confluentis]|uniref:Putative oxidoreductase n=1 Tax=Mycolicibacterium confluentis TaxID=28047 RepID=A0A7I7Y3A9_9MYCO|nr:flavin reductase family protein [Mycolicibacterium confluentis]MCV7318278.1 flavin reductase family protein [Mycolicibacterium confluentis]ORV29602.1 hypothetical protein AWB99_15455 [Mycolicibacterium confluentis]BBZ36190.1 putative oxidoreductase [Mycolicibacterium confluentis]